LIHKLKLERTLEGHTGCVNTLAWNKVGDKLLSGSDDCLLNIYQPYSYKLLHSVPSGHTANIFSAKFLPNTNDLKIVSCAGNGIVSYLELNTAGGCTNNNFFRCHDGTTYEVVTIPDEPNVFMTCCEDGKIRLFDLRVKTRCSSHDCNEDVLINCHRPTTAIAVDPSRSFQFTVGSDDSCARVFDRRNLIRESRQVG
ncbi:uncharacterized protein TRIADDRAFT_31737, partial [Trichoplax adhaerens]